MNREEMKLIKWSDDDHVWIGGRQFISLLRFAEAKKETLDEYIENIKRADAIAEENIHLRALLKEQLSEDKS